MSSKIVILLLVCLAVVQTSLALKCKKCMDCETSKTAVDEECNKPVGTQKWACLKEVYVDEAAKKQIVDKKCVLLPEGKSSYDCIKLPNTKQVSCETCEGDLCNAATSLSFASFVGITGVALACFAHKLFIH